MQLPRPDQSRSRGGINSCLLAIQYKEMVDYAAVAKDIHAILKKEGYDDGSIAPVLIRLAWHAAGTYDKATKTGGSDGATMRFAKESSDGANAGLEHARNFLEPIKIKHPKISYSDLWTLAGCVAVEGMGGPKVPWKPGRSDAKDDSACPPNGRLPDAAQGAQHVRDVFYRMGFNDREIVALIGAHSVGRCHADRSGFDGPWTFTPTKFTNQFFVQLLNNTWTKKNWKGPEQFQDRTGQLMMLPGDMAFIMDNKFKPIVQEYAKDQALFFKDFASAFGKLLELGVKRPSKL